MAYKKCKGWVYTEYIIATYPYCDATDTYFGCCPTEGDTVQCLNKKCKRHFVLGDKE